MTQATFVASLGLAAPTRRYDMAESNEEQQGLHVDPRITESLKEKPRFDIGDGKLRRFSAKTGKYELVEDEEE